MEVERPMDLGDEIGAARVDPLPASVTSLDGKDGAVAGGRCNQARARHRGFLGRHRASRAGGADPRAADRSHRRKGAERARGMNARADAFVKSDVRLHAHRIVRAHHSLCDTGGVERLAKVRGVEHPALETDSAHLERRRFERREARAAAARDILRVDVHAVQEEGPRRSVIHNRDVVHGILPERSDGADRLTVARASPPARTAAADVDRGNERTVGEAHREPGAPVRTLLGNEDAGREAVDLNPCSHRNRARAGQELVSGNRARHATVSPCH
mmetsp:Transcript_3305/g.11876  ORF Transcript_3305/g.11876 Transcript_3305/m.11876 type:complete len:273 (-) Transcript_3305:829-1647(-)